MAMYDPNEAEFWQQAASMAARAHAGQVRKDGRTPYAAHPFRVAFTVRHVFGCDDPVVIAAAMLHDTIEDTTVDYDDIAAKFGDQVARTVATVSKDKRLAEDERERRFYEAIACGDWRAQLVKLADAFDNVSDAPESKKLPGAIEKAKLALEAACDDERLRRAKEAVAELIEVMSREL